MRPKKTVTKSRSKSKPTFSATTLREDVDTYTEGIYALVALINHSRWSDRERRLRPHVKFGVGRRMLPCGEGSEANDVELTPDCAIQISSQLGIVGEAKPGVAKSLSAWNSNLHQLTKYNAELQGWWTENGQISAHDIVALVPMSRAVSFKDLVEARVAAGEVTFTRRFAIVAFFKHSGAENTFITLKTEFGGVTDAELNERLRVSKPVNWSHLIQNYKDPKFMDAEPPLAYTLWVLWDLVLSQMAGGRERENGVSWIGVDVDVASLTERVQTFYGFRSDGPHSVEIPRRRWIRRALDALVMFGMAKRMSDTQYQVRYRRLRARDMLTKFGELCFRHRTALERREAKKPLLVLAEAQPVGQASPASSRVQVREDAH